MDRTFLKRTENGKLMKVQDAANADYVRIPIGQYVGLCNCLRVVKQRALQIVEKSCCDANGLKLLSANHRVYNKSYDYKAWLITKQTPYSLKMPLEAVSCIIKKELSEHYNYIDISDVKIKALDFLQAITQRDDPMYNYDFYHSNSDYGRMIKALLDDAPENLIFEIVSIGAHYGEGVYTVSYWATEMI